MAFGTPGDGASAPAPILVTGAGGSVGGVGRTVVALLRERGLPVRAMVHREDERTKSLRELGAEVVTGDLTLPAEVARCLEGTRRVYFGMGVSSSYLVAAATVAAVARATGNLEVLVDVSQMTVSQMGVTSTEESDQQRLHWLAEQVLDWSGLPVVHLRPTVLLDNPLFTTLAARTIAERGVIRLPFGTGRSSPIAARDVARVAATVLADPAPHIGRVYELTGPRSQDMAGVAAEFSRALGRPVTHEDVPLDVWAEEVLAPAGLHPYVEQHIATMARLHRQGRYDRLTRTVEEITGTPGQTIEEYVTSHAPLFQPPNPG
ncbi:NAD(P)-dependent oxidoreductase [Sphaerisporangium melleum]|uniref:NAD(P)-dependent oxidoreductase n=1 Tax=Sphaerisporangium melleum TaxID=321316 RepID=A0A917RK55_9ACTN|nr:NAD(P)H-binding protein [Sphaerisporangium melleum]GGL12322.1 NAD(P)-dependent oxidoreductase [Sphaerisporangium melleum]GII74480.1 NAD(P)-dependent oxidoreductase [Sphaerisporangium melleum]